MSPSNDSLWIAAKKTLNYKVPITPIINSDVVYVYSVAELFKSHLAETFTPHPDIQTPDYNDLVNQFLDILLLLSLPVKHCTPNDVKFAIQKYSLKKSPCYDLIIAEVARCFPKEL